MPRRRSDGWSPAPPRCPCRMVHQHGDTIDRTHWARRTAARRVGRDLRAANRMDRRPTGPEPDRVARIRRPPWADRAADPCHGSARPLSALRRAGAGLAGPLSRVRWTAVVARSGLVRHPAACYGIGCDRRTTGNDRPARARATRSAGSPDTAARRPVGKAIANAPVGPPIRRCERGHAGRPPLR